MKRQIRTQIKSEQKGFSLVELIIVIAIMAILAAFLIPQFMKYINKAKVVRDIEEAQRIGRIVEAQVASDAAVPKEEKKFIYEENGSMKGLWVGQPSKLKPQKYNAQTLNEMLGIQKIRELETTMWEKRQYVPDVELIFHYWLEVSSKGEVTVYAKESYTKGNTIVEYKYQLYPNVEEGSPWDTK